MRKFVIVVVLLTMVSSKPHSSHKLKISPLMNRIQQGADTSYVVNFWATWCIPCVEELPLFGRIDSIHKNEKVKVILMSLDFERDMETKMLPLLKKKNIHAEAHLVDEINDNEWMPKVDRSWQGNIPATLIVNTKNNYRLFLPRETTRNEIDSFLKAAAVAN
jgi:thiol-disulfide isomerase/thioredoxin